MITTRRVVLLCIAILFAGAALYGVKKYRRSRPRPFVENTGDYTGPLTRAIAPFDASKKPSRPWLDPKRIAPPPTVYRAYHSSVINQETDYLLYLPPGYDDPESRDRRYPVIYWFHGYSCEPQHGMPFVEGLDAAIKAGKAPPAIAILPNGLFDSWFCDSTDGSQPVESVIMKDLIPHVDQTYRTIADGKGRALEGFSMGGWGAGHLAFKYPETFCAVTMVSAPFHPPQNFWQLHRLFNGDHAAYYAEDPVVRLRRDGPRLGAMVKIRLLCGDKDDQQHFPYNVALDERLSEWKVPHETIIIPGARHNDGEIYEHLGADAFAFYREIFR